MLAELSQKVTARKEGREGVSHSAKTKSFALTKSLKVSLVRTSTSEAEATAAAPRKASATVEKVRILVVLCKKKKGGGCLLRKLALGMLQFCDENENEFAARLESFIEISGAV